jgi:DNA processing protein
MIKDNITVVSGLATGVDTVVHETAIECDGRTIAVIGTPLSHNYPRENAELQRRIWRGMESLRHRIFYRNQSAAWRAALSG